ASGRRDGGQYRGPPPAQEQAEQGVQGHSDQGDGPGPPPFAYRGNQQGDKHGIQGDVHPAADRPGNRLGKQNPDGGSKDPETVGNRDQTGQTQGWNPPIPARPV